MRHLRPFLAALVLALAGLGHLRGQDRAVPPIANAVVRISSHGASATVICTETGRTWLLGCGHAYQGQERSKRMTLDIPCSMPGPTQQVGIQLVAVDYEADLSLVLLNAGPVEAYLPVAPAGFVPGRHLLSVGFDNMQLPATVREAHPLGTMGPVTFTRERPWHGRSGGALLDDEAGCLVGVVSGYEVTGQRRGMYVSHQTILNFLARQQAGQGRTA